MNVKVIVLYPPPLDVEAFESEYVGRHLPLMRQLLGPDIPLPTFRIVSSEQRPAAHYRLAEIHFESQTQLDEFVHSGRGQVAGESSRRVSTGGKPLVAVCVKQEEI
jgi:uncharacterized protein (TIGR02118 family)